MSVRTPDTVKDPCDQDPDIKSGQIECRKYREIKDLLPEIFCLSPDLMKSCRIMVIRVEPFQNLINLIHLFCAVIVTVQHSRIAVRVKIAVQIIQSCLDVNVRMTDQHGQLGISDNIGQVKNKKREKGCSKRMCIQLALPELQGP